MRKNYFGLLLMTLMSLSLSAQNVGVGQPTPDAKLDIFNTLNQDGIEMDHLGATGNAIDIDVVNSANISSAVWLKNYSVGTGHNVQMLNATTTSTGVLVNHDGLGAGTAIFLNNTANSRVGNTVWHEGLGRGAQIVLENTLNENIGIFSVARGAAVGVYGGAGSSNAQGIIGTNIYDGVSWYTASEGAIASGVQGMSETGLAGVSGYLWKRTATTATSLANTQAGYFAQLYGPSLTTDNWLRVCYEDASNTLRKIDGPGASGTIVRDLNEQPRLMTSIEAPEVLFNDYGGGMLVNGKATINLDPIYTKNIIVDADNIMRVFIQLEGNCKGVYVTNKSATGFEVTELDGGTSNIPFSYQVVANRANMQHNGRTVVFDSSKRFAPGPEAEPIKGANQSTTIQLENNANQ